MSISGGDGVVADGSARHGGPTGPARRSYLPQALGHGLAVLDSFDRRTPALTAAQIARRTGMTLPTLYRYLTLLESSGFIQRLAGGRYALGIRLVEFGGQALSRADVYRYGQPIVGELATELGLDVHLGQLYEGDVLHLGYGARPARETETGTLATTRSKLGERAPAHCTSLGKAMLAYVPTERVESTIRRYGWRPMTTNSIRSFGRLERELDDVRSRGFAIDREEKVAGVRCLAAPVYVGTPGRGGEVVCAISATGPARVFRSAKNLDRIAQMAVTYAQMLGERVPAA